MLDLLIHVTAANKISPAAHLLQVTDEEGRLLPHKPSAPIGMHTTILYVVVYTPMFYASLFTNCPGSIRALVGFIEEEIE